MEPQVKLNMHLPESHSSAPCSPLFSQAFSAPVSSYLPCSMQGRMRLGLVICLALGRCATQHDTQASLPLRAQLHHHGPRGQLRHSGQRLRLIPDPRGRSLYVVGLCT